LVVIILLVLVVAAPYLAGAGRSPVRVVGSRVQRQVHRSTLVPDHVESRSRSRMPAPIVKLDEAWPTQKSSRWRKPKNGGVLERCHDGGRRPPKRSVIQKLSERAGQTCAREPRPVALGYCTPASDGQQPEPIPTSIRFQNTVDMIELPRRAPSPSTRSASSRSSPPQPQARPSAAPAPCSRDAG